MNKHERLQFIVECALYAFAGAAFPTLCILTWWWACDAFIAIQLNP